MEICRFQHISDNLTTGKNINFVQNKKSIFKCNKTLICVNVISLNITKTYFDKTYIARICIFELKGRKCCKIKDNKPAMLIKKQWNLRYVDK